MKKLCINIDHIATLREARGGIEPDPVLAVGICEMAGADGIVVHLREDRRHINDRDLRMIRDVVKTKLDLEMAATQEMLVISKEIMPEMVTIVPEKRQELTTEGGLDVVSQLPYLKDYIKQLHDSEVEVSLFIDPVIDQINASLEVGADYIELHTGEYAQAVNPTKVEQERKRLEEAAVFAYGFGLKVNAGHGLNYHNIGPILSMRQIGEMSIGHAIISRSIFTGLDRAVHDMVQLFRLYK